MKKRGKWLVLVVCVGSILAFAAYLFLTGLQADETAPEISMASEELEVSIHEEESALLEGISAMDDRDGDVTGNLLVEGVSSIREGHTAQVTYAAFDRAGNVAKAQRTIHYTDYRSPRFTLSKPLIFRNGLGQDLFDAVGAEDVLDGDLSNKIKATMVGETVVLAEAGSCEIEFRVTNSMGDTSYLRVPVDLYTSGRYNAELQLKEYLVYLKQGSRFSPEAYLDTLRAGREDISLGDGQSNVTVDAVSDVNTREPGCYSVAYTVKYGNYTGYSRLIVVVEE